MENFTAFRNVKLERRPYITFIFRCIVFASNPAVFIRVLHLFLRGGGGKVMFGRAGTIIIT